MKLAHAGMGITSKDYAAFGRCLAATLEQFKVPEPEREEVSTLVGSLESQIVDA
jgi:hypothetical protein